MNQTLNPKNVLYFELFDSDKNTQKIMKEVNVKEGSDIQ